MLKYLLPISIIYIVLAIICVIMIVREVKKNDNKEDMTLIIISFLVPLIGLIIYAVNVGKDKHIAECTLKGLKLWLKFLVAQFIISIIVVLLMMFFFFYNAKHINHSGKEPITQEEITEPLKTYIYASYLYENGNFEQAKEKFTSILDYENSKSYLNNINTLQELNIIGLWYNWFNKDIDLFIDITPTTCYMYIKEDYDIKLYSSEKLSFDSNKISCGDYIFTSTIQKYWDGTNDDGSDKWREKQEYILHNDKITDKNIFQNRQFTKSKQTISYEPQINMTKEKVFNSILGKPIKEESYIMHNEIKEIWNYESKKIYFTNGIVTSITN